MIGESLTTFVPFSKMPRLSRDCIITEKIDGTNACITITEDGEFLTGSRTRWVIPGDDNFGFSAWAHDRKDELMALGVGRHFGEWWGEGIQRKYGLAERRFSLFNVSRWYLAGTEPQVWKQSREHGVQMQEALPNCCSLVPVLFRGAFSTDYAENIAQDLRIHGSYAAPGFMNPEGIVVFHVAAGIGFKKTLERDEVPKGLVDGG